MPWLAIPYLESEKRKHLKKLFKVWEIPHVVILNENGKVVNDEGVEIIRHYGVEAYPFNRKRIKELKKLQEEAKKEQTLKSILVSPGRDFVVSNDGKRVPISELEGKTVGLYFFLPLDYPCPEFTPRLVEVYESLKKRGDSFETVMVCLDDDEEEEESFRKAFASMPWLALPFKEKTCQKPDRYFQKPLPRNVVIIGPDGKTLHQNAAYAIEEYGTLAYHFTPERFAELPKVKKALQEAQTLESILVSDDQNFLIGKDGAKVKTIFSTFQNSGSNPVGISNPS